MNFLKTFFGMVLRRPDVDFIQSSGRDGVVDTHYDLTNSRGGVIQGLDVSVSSDSLSILVSPGVFYNGGPINSNNGLGGGERGQIFEQRTFTNLPNTPLIGTQQSYLVVYVKTVVQNNNPDPTKSQAIITSKNIQTGETIAVRNYTTGSIVVTNPVLPAQFNLVNGIPLALLQVNQGAITIITSAGGVSYSKRKYVVGGVVDIESQTVTDSTVNYIISKIQLSGNALGAIDSSGLSVWDGASDYNSLSGDGIANQHIKKWAVTEDKIHPTLGLANFSTDNYVFNGSFEILENGGDPTVITGWNTWIQASDSVWNISANTGPQPFGAGITKVSDVVYDGFKSIAMSGINATQIGNSPQFPPYGLSMWQDIPFSGQKINETPVMSSFFLRSDTGINVISGFVEGITATIQFTSAGTLLADGVHTVSGYSGTAVGWTKFGLSSPVQYTGSATTVDGIRFMVSGTLNNTSTVYIDDVYVGLTSIEPAWTDSQADKDYSDTLVKNNITTSNLTVNASADIAQLNPVGNADIGTSTAPFNTIYSNAIFLNGVALGAGGPKFQIFSTVGTNSWTVPDNVSSITVEMCGGGGGGGAGGGVADNGGFVAPGPLATNGGDSSITTSSLMITASGGHRGQVGSGYTGGAGGASISPSITSTSLLSYASGGIAGNDSSPSNFGPSAAGADTNPVTSYFTNISITLRGGGGTQTGGGWAGGGETGPASAFGIPGAGGGGGANDGTEQGAGGGSGGMAQYGRFTIPVTPGEVLTIAVGAGGAGGGLSGGANSTNPASGDGGKGVQGLVIINY